MNILLIFLAGVVTGVVGTWVWEIVRERITTPQTPPWKGGEEEKETLIRRQRREKEKDNDWIYGLLETNTPLSNSHVEMMLGIPESTATRYFDELEKEGKVRQVGKTGAGVHYERL